MSGLTNVVAGKWGSPLDVRIGNVDLECWGFSSADFLALLDGCCILEVGLFHESYVLGFKDVVMGVAIYPTAIRIRLFGSCELFTVDPTPVLLAELPYLLEALLGKYLDELSG